MAITKKISPWNYYPAYNDQFIVLDSSNRTEDRFKYVVQVFDDSANELGRLRTPPNRQSYGQIEINNILKDYVDLELNYDTLKQTFNEHFFKYNLVYGEEYVFKWQADEVADNGGYVNLISSTDDHIYSVGDVISVVSPDENVVRSGIFRVSATPTTKSITLNQVFQSASVILTFDIQYSNNRSTQFLNLDSDGPAYVFNAAFDYIEWTDYDLDTYAINDSNGELLTTTPTTIQVFEDDFFTANYITDSDSDVIQLEYISSSFSGSTSLFAEYGTVGLGPQNLVTWVAAYNAAQADKNYKVRVYNVTQSTYSPWYNFEIIDSCSKFDNHKIIWLDKKGGWKSFNFNLVSKKTIKADKRKFKGKNVTTYNSSLNQLVNDTERFAERIQVSHIDEEYTVQSNLMTSFQIELLEDLFTSRFVYKYDDVNGKLMPIILSQDTYDKEDLMAVRMKTVNMKYKFSNKNTNN